MLVQASHDRNLCGVSMVSQRRHGSTGVSTSMDWVGAGAGTGTSTGAGAAEVLVARGLATFRTFVARFGCGFADAAVRVVRRACVVAAEFTAGCTAS